MKFMKIQIRLIKLIDCLEGLGWASLNTGLHSSMAVMIDLCGSSANTENLLRIRSGPANRLKETVHSSPVVKVRKPTKTMVEVTFNTDTQITTSTLLWETFTIITWNTWNLIFTRLCCVWLLHGVYVILFYKLSFNMVLFPSPVGKVQNNNIKT